MIMLNRAEETKAVEKCYSLIEHAVEHLTDPTEKYEVLLERI